MRDRMEELEALHEEASEGSEEEWAPAPPSSSEEYSGDEKEVTHQEAVVFEEEDSAMKEVLEEAQAMRKEVALLRMEVERLRSQASRCKKTVRRLSFMSGSNAIGLGVKRRAEAMVRRLDAYDRLRQDLELRHGPHTALVRVARAQHLSVGHALAHALEDYNSAELELREECRSRLQRQAEILGRSVTEQQVEEMVQEGGWGAFSHDLHPEGMTARCAFRQVRERHRDLVELESRLRDVHDLFLTMALMVEQQGALLNNVEANVLATHDYMEKVNEHFKAAIKYRKKNPCAQMFCGCFPCWKQATG
ncbi:hypothetical protein ACEWY4_022016 [Coilia grayii]|uniref:t-SNARE coiled-coil homology domain-containing protein n=1 Tax=Coilia grayii TaxID=363190 RepID=A0ABD1J4U7_9TELE